MNGHTQSITYCKSAKATNPIKLNAGLFLSIKAIDADILRVIEIEMESNKRLTRIVKINRDDMIECKLRISDEYEKTAAITIDNPAAIKTAYSRRSEKNLRPNN